MARSETPLQRPPAPRSISSEARQYLEMGLGDLNVLERPTDLNDVEAWLAYANAADDVLVQLFTEHVPANLPLERTDIEADGVRTYVLRPTRVADSKDTPIYIELHGGGFIMGGGEACVAMATPGALGRDMITWAVDYRMPPLHTYPAPLDDCMTVYRRVLDERDPRDIFVGGGSAGGNFSAALLLRAKAEGLPMPAGVMLLTPAVDLTASGDTFQILDGIDHVLPSMPMDFLHLYAGGHDLANPYLSPLFGDVTGFPPSYLQSGTRDLLLSSTVLMHRKLRAAGVEAELHVGEAMGHAGFGGTTPEDLELVAEQARFLDKHRQH